MKRFVIKTTLFLVPVAILAMLLELGLRSIPNDYLYKSQWLEDHVSEIRIMSFGSSHGYYGINPNVFSESAFNGAHLSQTLGFDYFIFSKYVEKADSLKYLILPVSYSSLTQDKMIGGKEKWRNKKYMLYYNCPYRKCSFKNLEIWDGKLHKNCIRLFRYLFQDVNEIYVDGRGWCQMESDGLKDDGEEAAKRHTASKISDDLVESNKERLKNMIEICQAKDIEVILLTMPAYESYRSKLNSDQLSITINSCHDLASSYENIIYLNFLSDTRFGRNDFLDSDHLNSQGATKLSLALQHVMDSLEQCH